MGRVIPRLEGFSIFFTQLVLQTELCVRAKKVSPLKTKLSKNETVLFPLSNPVNLTTLSLYRIDLVKINTKVTAGQDPPITRDYYEKLIDEWQCALKGETLRITLRVDLLKFNALESIREILDSVYEAFHEVYNDICAQYRKELCNIEIACNVFRSAVENEEAVQKELLFDEQMFTINPEINMFDNLPIISQLPKEVINEGEFTISQLSKLVDILQNISPDGYILRTTFIFLLQDIIWVRPENSSTWLSPNLWRKLDPHSLKNIIDLLFDDLEYVYWKEFIIYNIRINYPSERELLVTRQSLRDCDPDATELIQDYQFFSIKLWFEYVFLEKDFDKILNIKRLLYKLYNIKNHGLNYTAMLLDFCKGANAAEGFAKALALSVGKTICWDTNIGNKFVEEYERKIKEHNENVQKREEERTDYYNAAYEEVSKLVDYVVHICDDVVIEEVNEVKERESANINTGRSRVRSILKKSDEEGIGQENNKEENLSFKNIQSDVEESQELRSNETINEQNNKSDNSSQLIKICKDLPDNVSTDVDEYPGMVFFLQLDVVVTIITAALPWHSRVQNIGEMSFWENAIQIFEECRNPNFNKAVLAHEFLNSEAFLKLLSLTKKFLIIDPVRVVNDIVIEIEANN